MDTSNSSIDFEILWKKLHASLTEEEEEQLAQWLQKASHRRYFERLSQISRSSPPPSSPDVSQAWRMVARRTADPARPVRRRTVYLSGVAAGLLLLVIGGYLGWFSSAPPSAEPPSSTLIEPGTDRAVLVTEDGATYDLSAGHTLSLQTGHTEINSQGTSLAYTAAGKVSTETTYHTLKIPRGGEFTLTLSDQTQVWLNAETVLRFPTHFSGTYREVELTGEAYFKVSKDPTKPFRVISGNQLTEVLGTSFNVSCYEEDSLIYTTLVEGKVNVSSADHPAVQQTLRPHHQSYLSKATGALAQQAVDPQPYVAWQQGRFYFKDEPLEKLMTTLSRWYDVEVTFANAAARHYRFTGNLERYQDFEHILNLLQATEEVTFEVAGRSITVE